MVGIGTHTITVTATDAAGNSANCTTTFTVTDNAAPIVICSAMSGANADANCQAPVPNVLGGVSVGDNCSGPSAITLVQSPAAGTLVGIGTHTITVTATDAAGNSATCTTSFTVLDSTAPIVICSAVPTANADANCQAAVPSVLGGLTVSDNCSGVGALTLSQSPAAGTLVGPGTHTITVTATDAAGNSAICTTTFTVTDNTAPVVICSAVSGVFADANCQAAVPSVLGGVSASDNCSGPSAITLSQSPPAGTLVGVGTHTITVTATDGAGNSATCTTTFTVTDNAAPLVVCSVVPGASTDADCQAVVPNVLGGVSVSDNCSGPGAITLSQSPAAGTLVGVGTHAITVTAVDAAGNSATCSTTFTVADNAAPVVICSTVPLGTGCQSAVPDVLGGVSVSDNCSVASAITLSQSPTAGTLVGVGTHTITVTATDAAGNSATCATAFTVEAVLSASGPTNLVRYSGQSASFSTSASGTGPFSYQWRKDGVDIPGATSETYTNESVTAADAGNYCVVVTGFCNSVTNCATLTVMDCLSLSSEVPQLNRQSGLFEQKVHVTNSTEFTLSAVRVFITVLTEGAGVYNASGDLDGVPYVKYNQELVPGEAADLTIEYYVADRRTPEAELCARLTFNSAPVPQDGTPVTIDRKVWLANGTFLIEFAAVPGQVFHIQYSDDSLNWKTVTPGVSTGANRIQWIDNGPPKTESLPNGGVIRVYRVITLP